MKRIIFTILLFCLISSRLLGQIVVERVFLSTDKENYVAGENIWLSGFSFKIENGKRRVSDISSLMYIEIYAEKRPVLNAKMALKSGRGSAYIQLPLTLPTGVYKIVAYTSYMRNEKPLPLFEKRVSIYNTLTAERLSGVKIARDSGEVKVIAKSNNITNNKSFEVMVPLNGLLKPNSSYELSLSNLISNSISASVSVYKDDKLPDYDNIYINTFLNGKIGSYSGIFAGGFIPEYEGEIVKGRIVPANGTKYEDLTGMNVFLSIPGGDGEIYTAVSDKKGEVSFFTDNIYGKRECVLEVVPKDTASKFTVELQDPFIHPEVIPAEQLILHSSMAPALEERSFGMQVNKRFGTDSLIDFTIPRHNPFLGGKKKVYLLDDYTRFPVMEEVIIEYVAELRYRRRDKKAQIHIRWDDSFNSVSYSRDNTLVLIDGIPIFEQSKVLDYDPLKVKSLSIYGDRYYIGNLSYTGIANFKTYSGKYPGLSFDKNVRIVDFDGTQPFSKLSGQEIEKGKYPDFRNTIYWDPILTIPALGERRVNLLTPSVEGRYKIVIQGVSELGEPFVYVKEFSVE